MPAAARLYKLYDNDDQLVFVGTSAECRNKWYMKGGFHLGTYVRKLKFRKRYTVVPYGEELEEYRVPKDRVIRIKKRYVEQPGEEDRRLNYVMRMLEKHGNTVMRAANPKKYFDALNDKGYNVIKEMKYDSLDNTTYYIITLIERRDNENIQV